MVNDNEVIVGLEIGVDEDSNVMNVQFMFAGRHRR